MKKNSIEYRLHILGIRVWADTCQLIDKDGDSWRTIGVPRKLPISIPQTASELKKVEGDPLCLTAAQYCDAHQTSDLAEMLSQRKEFSAKMKTLFRA